MTKIFKLLAMFLWRKYMNRVPVPHPDGIPYERDPDAPCEFYEPFKGRKWYFRDCETDGHYLCAKCIHNVKNNTLKMKTANGTKVTPEALLQVVKKSLGEIVITPYEEKTLKSMLAEHIETEDMRPGNDICDFLGIERRYNRNEINNGIHDFINKQEPETA